MSTRLVAEAEWLESVAEDERATGVFLQELSTAHSILHDLKLEGVQGNVDHVIVGPGGAFVVVTRRFAQPLAVSGTMLYSGDRPLRPEFDALKVVAARLADTLGTPVMPVMAFHGGVLPASAPQEVEGVYICGVENVVRVVTRASHTLLAPHKVTEITERALPHLFNPGSVARTQTEAPPQVAAPATINPWIPDGTSAPAGRDDETLNILRKASGVTAAGAAASTSPSFAQLDAALARPAAVSTPAPSIPTVAPATAATASTSLAELSRVSMAMGATATAGAETVPDGLADERPAKQPKPPKEPKQPRPAKQPKSPGAGRSRGFTIAIVLSLCLVAATVGAGLAVMQNGDEVATTTPLNTTVVTASSTPTGPMAASLPAPAVSFSATCLTPGAGWDWVATWPGDLAGLVQYDVEYLNADGSWTVTTPLTSSAVTVSSLGAQPPLTTVTFRITAVMQDSSRSINQAVAFTSPEGAC